MERRRIERNLHDGTQQRLVSISMALGLAEARLTSDPDAAAGVIREARESLGEALQELRELSQGIHPGLLTERGLGPALHELAYRAPVPVQIDVGLDSRLPEQVEAAAYYLVAEALANVAKHSSATRASVSVERDNGRALVAVEDDGRGGADPAHGSGLRGLADRVEALGGAPRGRERRGPRHDDQSRDPVRVVIADDSALLRQGVAQLLLEAGFDVAGQATDGDELLALVEEMRPDVAVVDIRMPPTHTDEGIRAAKEIRTRFPEVAVLVLSQYVRPSYALELLEESAERIGYLLKDRVSDVHELADAIRRVGQGGSVLDPSVVSQLVGRRRQDGDPIEDLSDREREVLALVAEGRTNQAIATRLFITERTVEKHVKSILGKLRIPAGADDHRRVLLPCFAYLESLAERRLTWPSRRHRRSDQAPAGTASTTSKSRSGTHGGFRAGGLPDPGAASDGCSQRNEREEIRCVRGFRQEIWRGWSAEHPWRTVGALAGRRWSPRAR